MMHRTIVFTLILVVGFAALLAGCVGEPAAVRPSRPESAHALIDRALPASVADRAGWAADMYASFTELAIPSTHENICAVVAVIEQESGFRVDPVVAGLPAIAWREIDSRAGHAGLPRSVVHTVLQLKSANGRSYSDRIDAARTEKDLSDIFEDFVGSVPLGRSLFASWNPIRTRGPMQVNIAFAEQYAAVRPYPYPVKLSIDDEVFTRRGSLYFGTAHLLAYQPSYDRYLYRFADYNAGQYASRNAAFQSAVSMISGVPLVADGALLPHDGEASDAGSTESALRGLAGRLNLGESAIHNDLAQGRTQNFSQTPLYQRLYALAQREAKHPLPRALIPRIELHGPKISRRLTTAWYAQRVDDRFRSCLNR